MLLAATWLDGRKGGSQEHLTRQVGHSANDKIVQSRNPGGARMHFRDRKKHCDDAAAQCNGPCIRKEALSIGDCDCVISRLCLKAWGLQYVHFCASYWLPRRHYNCSDEIRSIADITALIRPLSHEGAVGWGQSGPWPT